MDIQKIKELALVNGFKLKEQADGSMDLNAYVYDFANAIEQAAKAHEAEKLKGCVVVPKDKIEVWWQDAEEPENFATQLKDLHFIADGLEDGDIMKIHEHHTIHMPSNTLYGAWIYKDGERVFITGTKAEVEEAARGGK